MPHGDVPAGTRDVTASVPVSITLTSLEGPLAVYSVLPSGVMPTPHGRSPTSGIVCIKRSPTVSMTATDLPRPVVTYAREPSGERTTPIGRTSSSSGPWRSGIDLTTVRAATSTTSTVPSFSQVTYALAPSGVNAAERGRAAVLISAATALLAVSMTCTEFEDSPVTYTHRPSGLIATPSGS
jgi:hypothetical protein